MSRVNQQARLHAQWSPQAQIAGRLESMIAIQMEAYPSHWSDADRREMAERHLFGSAKA